VRQNNCTGSATVVSNVAAWIDSTTPAFGKVGWHGHFVAPPGVFIASEFGPYQLLANDGRSGEMQPDVFQNDGDSKIVGFSINGDFQ
jgi:hypothetical protein